MIMPNNLGKALLWIFRPRVQDTTASSKVLKVQSGAGVDKFTVDIEGDVVCHDITASGSFTRSTDDFATGLTIATDAAAFATAGTLRIGTGGASNFTVSAAGAVVVGSTLQVTGVSTLTGGLTIGTGAFVVATTTGILTMTALANLNGGIAIDTNKFTVSAAGAVAVCTNKFTVSAAGAVLIASTVTANGAIAANAGLTSTTVAMTGILSGALSAVVAAASGTTSLTAAQSGATCVNTGTGATTTFQLPDAAAGLSFTFIENGDAVGEIRILPAAGDIIVGKTHAANDGTGIATAAGAGLKNTAATNVKGDFCKLVATDDGTWCMVAEAGVWAAI